MTNNAPVFWEVCKADGSWFSLHTYAWSVKSSGGRRWTAGAKRGEDLLMPHVRGRVFQQKTREAQNFELGMWVFPTNEDGSKDANKTVEQKAHQNFRKIISAVDQEGQFFLRKRWHEDDSVRNDFGTQSNVASAIGTVEFMDASGPDSDDGKGYNMNLTLTMADPYFYGNVITGPGNPGDYTVTDKTNTAITLDSNGYTPINVMGDAPTDHIWLSFAGGSDAIVAFPDGNWIQYLGSQSDGSEVIIDCRRGLAIRKDMFSYFSGDYSGVYLNGLIRRNPYFTNWPTLNPAKYPTSTIGAAGGGSMKLVYDPAYR